MRLHVHLSSNWVLDTDMREYRPDEEVDFCVIGTGAGGGVLAQRLARFGFSVVALEAGPWHDTETDMVSDEAGSSRLYWTDVRITGGLSRSNSAPTTRAAELVAAPSITLDSVRAFTRRTSACVRWMASRPTGRSATRTSNRITPPWSASTPYPGLRTIHGANRTGIHTHRCRLAPLDRS